MEQEKMDIQEDLNILAAAKAYISGDPLCHRKGCNGTGVLGLTVHVVDDKKKARLLTCSCAKYGKTDYQRLINEISSLSLQDRNLFLAIDKRMIDLHRHTLSGFIVWKLGVFFSNIRLRWQQLRKKESK